MATKKKKAAPKRAAKTTTRAAKAVKTKPRKRQTALVCSCKRIWW